jgi:hypothetical protein
MKGSSSSGGGSHFTDSILVSGSLKPGRRLGDIHAQNWSDESKDLFKIFYY